MNTVWMLLWFDVATEVCGGPIAVFGSEVTAAKACELLTKFGDPAKKYTLVEFSVYP